MSSVARQEVTTEVTTPPSTDTAPIYRVELQPRPHVTFDESVVDNEHLGRRRSNKCCIFHKKREFGESSSESGEDSDGSDSGGEHHNHNHSHDCKNKARRRRTRPKKQAPSPSSSDEEKMSAPAE
ncbi:Protein phosphatase inhibitor [Phytophthora infestans]|uniref:Protein phosphatase inhibitor n=1 Tax=Phytophthora infestans TaxID=4787 RepID=A0A833WHD4_PHYIN|nr:Protein phosphatase inhibitor [Phytophthora infestans]KAF4137862.1 Protein phosphatase inhibitor [Phytophthora infestans]